LTLHTAGPDSPTPAADREGRRPRRDGVLWSFLGSAG
jgi:hypothetical protein